MKSLYTGCNLFEDKNKKLLHISVRHARRRLYIQESSHAQTNQFSVSRGQCPDWVSFSQPGRAQSARPGLTANLTDSVFCQFGTCSVSTSLSDTYRAPLNFLQRTFGQTFSHGAVLSQHGRYTIRKTPVRGTFDGYFF